MRTSESVLVLTLEDELHETQNVDVPLAVVSRDSGQDSGYVANPFMCVTK